MNPLLEQLCGVMQGLRAPWAICGGMAVDLYLGRATRPHGDVDLCVVEDDRAQVLRHVLDRGWHVCEFRGNGKVRPLDAQSVSERGRNLMCLQPEGGAVRFWPCDEEGLLWHEFLQEDMRVLNYFECLFSERSGDELIPAGLAGARRAMDKAILRREGVPFLAPEIVLAYKALRAQEAKHQADFAVLLPHLDAEQRAWLRQCLSAGHPWLEALA